MCVCEGWDFPTDTKQLSSQSLAGFLKIQQNFDAVYMEMIVPNSTIKGSVLQDCSQHAGKFQLQAQVTFASDTLVKNQKFP